MLNNTSSLPKLSAQGQLARGDESSIAAKAVDRQAESFGSVLSRQMSGNTAADKTADNAKSADSKSTTATDETEPQAALAIPADQAASPLVMLLLASQESKPAIAPEASDKAVVAAEPGAAAATDIDVKKTTESSGETTGVSNKAAAEFIGATRDKSDAPAPSAVTSADLAAKPGLRSEPLKATELTSALPVQPPQAQAGTTPASGNTITAPLGHSAWPAEFSQKVSWISTQKNQVAELHLNPPDLGPINIVLKISDNQATALFTSPHSAVRDAIENAIPKLRESLADNGIMLGEATVSDQAPRDNSANHMNHRAYSRTTTDNTDTAESSALASLPLTTARQHKGMVDTFA